jgi:hypothetical protein
MFGLSTVCRDSLSKKIVVTNSEKQKNFLFFFFYILRLVLLQVAPAAAHLLAWTVEKKSKMVVSAKSLPRGNLGRNFAEHRGTADLLQTGDV